MVTTAGREVPFYPVTEMTKLRTITSIDGKKQHDVLEPVAASLDVNRQIFITLFCDAVERGEIKLADISEAGILGSLRLLSELLEERGRMYATFSEARNAVSELTAQAITLGEAHEHAGDLVDELETQTSDVQDALDAVNNALLEATDTFDELEGLFDDVGDGS